jgi:hypothetical protein
MKSLHSLCALFISTCSIVAADEGAIQSALLDDRSIYTVPVGTNRVTTISFPGPISAMDGAGVTMDVRVPGQFQLAHSRGSSFLSVRALVPKATANLNIRWNKRTYVFELVESSTPVLSLILEAKPVSLTPQSTPALTPTRLLSLLDKAKAFPLLKKQQPDAVSEVDFMAYPERGSVSDYNEYEIRLEEAFRFNAEDTLVFRALLRNKTAQAITYRPGSFALRVGNRLYHQSVSDAPGVIPANGESTVYFAITGTPDGGRNELSLKNSFSVVIVRFSTPKEETQPPVQSQENK